MTLNFAICDDNGNDRKEVSSLLTNYAFNHDYDFYVEEFENGRELLARYHTKDIFQVLLIDIEMQGESGIDIADIIKRTIDHDVMIVFVSNYPEYMQTVLRCTHTIFFKNK